MLLVLCDFLSADSLQLERGLRAVVEPFALASKDMHGNSMLFSAIGLEQASVTRYITRICDGLESCGVASEQVDIARRTLTADPLLSKACKVSLLTRSHQHAQRSQ